MSVIHFVVPDRTSEPDTGHPHRWIALAVVCFAVFVTVLDGTVVNVALPSLAVELGASTRQLQWIVDSYLLVFTGLLLAAGGLGDKFGRKRLLMTGLLVFGVTSAYAGSVDSSGALIAGRALMVIGAAMIFPATLAILTNVFHDAGERAKAIGIWSAVSGVAVAAGPITGGWLLEHLWWGSVFFINVPITILVALAAWRLVPPPPTPFCSAFGPPRSGRLAEQNGVGGTFAVWGPSSDCVTSSAIGTFSPMRVTSLRT